jgi:hypothetical protein
MNRPQMVVAVLEELEIIKIDKMATNMYLTVESLSHGRTKVSSTY